MIEQRQSQIQSQEPASQKTGALPSSNTSPKPENKQLPKRSEQRSSLKKNISQKPGQPAKQEQRTIQKPLSKPPEKQETRSLRPSTTKPPPKKIRQRIADLKELAIAIDSYEDLFSDFDPRKYENRELSEDFLYEIKRRYRETGKGQFEVIFHAPKTLHDESVEKIVIQRIKRHFRGMAKGHQKALANIRLRGTLYIIFGIILLTALTLMAYGKILPDFQIELLGVIFLPLGWFGVWEGFSKIIDVPYKLSSDLRSFEKLAKATYQFKFLE